MMGKTKNEKLENAPLERYSKASECAQGLLVHTSQRSVLRSLRRWCENRFWEYYQSSIPTEGAVKPGGLYQSKKT